MELLMGRRFLSALLSVCALWRICSASQTDHHSQVSLHQDRDVIDILEILSITNSPRGITKVKGHDPGMAAWRFRCRTPHLTLPLDVYRRFVRAWRGSLSLYLVGQQFGGSAVTLLSLSAPGNTPLLRIISNTQEDFLQLEIRTEHSTELMVLRIPGGNPFSGGRWARMVLGVAPGWVWLEQECKEATVLKFAHQGRPLTLNLPPHDLQVTLASKADDKASKFSGYLQIAQISTKRYERRPWLCSSVTDSAPITPTPYSTVDLEQELRDEPERTAGSVLGPPAAPHREVAHSEQKQQVRNLEETLHNINTMLIMLKEQNERLQSRVQYLESCECVRKTCVWENHKIEEGSRWRIDNHTECSCSSGRVQCETSNRCAYKGGVYEHEEVFVPRTNPCLSCICSGGKVVCNNVPCPTPDCGLVETVSGECCPRCRSCVQEGVWHEHGSKWKDLRNPCSVCTCSEGRVECSTERCNTVCRDPAPSPGNCCPPCNHCAQNGQQFLNGEPVPSRDRCKQCVCKNGNINCEPLPCPTPSCSHPIRRAGDCCPKCLQCNYESEVYSHGQHFTSKQNPCMTCQCLRGSVRCHQESCPPVRCPNPVRDARVCCPVCKACVLGGEEYEHGAVWDSEDTPCTKCSCVEGNVRCQVKDCPPLSCRHPNTESGECCPSCNHCFYKQRVYENGQRLSDPDDPCSSCTCQNGSVVCSAIYCPQVSCFNRSTVPGECCPQCPTCVVRNHVYVDGERFTNPENPCEECVCRGGGVECLNKCPKPNCRYPVTGTCCQNNCNGCSYAGKDYPNGMEFPHPTDSCRECHCLNGNVQCRMRRCPPLQCGEPIITQRQCCPQCPAPPADCVYVGQSFRHTQRFYHPTDSCQLCSCTNGTVSCHHKPCPSAPCTHPVQQECCRTCDGCLYNSVEHANGERFADVSDPCGTCVCREGTVTCERRHCPQTTCPFPVQTECCQSCNGCHYAGVNYLNGQEFLDPSDHCNRCSCINGDVTCRQKPCYTPGCSHPAPSAGHCCPVCDGCSFHGQVYEDGNVFPSPNAECEECTCSRGEVSCTPRSCPRVSCPHPAVDGCGCADCNRCNFHGRVCENRENFSDPKDNCQTCTCLNGDVSCLRTPCPQQCTHPARSSGCCPVCDTCLYEDVQYTHAQVFTSPSNPCLRCTCVSGSVTCTQDTCPVIKCHNPVTPPGHCCPQCRVCVQNSVEYQEGDKVFSQSDHCSQCVCQNSVEYQEGDKVFSQSDHCSQCVCQDGEVICAASQCAKLNCMHQVIDPGSCCPRCRGCVYDGVEHSEGSTWFASSGPCMSCMCVDGVTTCSEIQCLSPCINQITVPGECCPLCADCVYEGRVYGPGENFHPSDDPCQMCTCEVMPDGQQHLRCYRKQCPRLVDCPKNNIMFSSPDSCCPVCAQPLSICTEALIGNEVLATDDPCFTCQCKDGEVICAASQCAKLNCMHQVIDPGSCCPRCRGCVYDGLEHSEGRTWFASSGPCMSCMCVDGVTTCSEIQCLSPCINQITVPGECCPLCADCVYEGRVYGPGENFHPSDDPCQMCTCEVMPDGQQHLRCYRKQCPRLVDCPKNNIMFSSPDSCCPVCAQPLSICTEALIGNEVLATDDPCFTCQCKDLTWTCIHKPCPTLSCPPDEQNTPPDSCCPVCDVCVVEGGRRRVNNGESWTDGEDECITCSCKLGHIECNIEECAPLVCEVGLLKVKSPGKCCYECQDVRAQCVYEGQVYDSKAQWEVDECTSCTCVSGDVHCQTERCPALSCASDETPSVIPGMCCPRCIPRPATCIVFGDPHYRTFDGKMVNFQGTCTYVLAQDCQGGDFSVHVTNDDRSRKGVSWTKEVTVYIRDIVIQLLQDWVVQVDHQTITLPFLKEPYIYLERKSNTILLNTNVGMKVLWNGRSHLEVSVPGTYKEHMCGLCGNFNNYPQDDMRLRNGQITTSEATFGNNWKVDSGNDRGALCSDARDIDPCKKAGYSSRKTANSRCAVLKSAVFERCHRVVPPEMFFASCVYDLCACAANADECLCDALEAYASECREAGVVLQWRSPSLCAVGCPVDRGYVFDECGPPCPKTCFNKDVPLGVIEAHCFKPCVPGCQCPAGLVEHESHCISPEKCPKIIHGNP
ncbi:hypothetical protein PDJAM_G00226190 [Pangasius djambal]|uniref:Uncharacterized protein n=1 Tax=Pangasius djambal TaxID=1691987 RepID=A0ACC5YDE2_9TELE|nr:hypothetical protein [Pangasius djambal]